MLQEHSNQLLLIFSRVCLEYACLVLEEEVDLRPLSFIRYLFLESEDLTLLNGAFFQSLQIVLKPIEILLRD